MAGHSKWANIRFRKGNQDIKRGKIFTKLIREITVAARLGGEDETSNPRLRDAVIKSLKANMKRDTIDNAIKRGTGGLDNDNLVELRYEGYASHGVAILVDCLTDNKNRTVSEVRHAFTKFGGNLGTDGSVSYLFIQQGEILVSAPKGDEKIIEIAIENGAEDFIIEGEQVEIITTAEGYHPMLDAIQQAGYLIEQSELTMHAQTRISLEKETAESLIKLIDALEDLDDVQNVYSNAEYPSALFEEGE